MSFRLIAKVLAWLAFLAVAAATLSPIDERPRLPAPVHDEHLLAFLVIGFLFALAYPRRILLIAVLVTGGIVALELLQTLRPDRHARLADALWKLAGATTGLAAGWLTTHLAPRFRK